MVEVVVKAKKEPLGKGYYRITEPDGTTYILDVQTGEEWPA